MVKRAKESKSAPIIMRHFKPLQGVNSLQRKTKKYVKGNEHFIIPENVAPHSKIYFTLLDDDGSKKTYNLYITESRGLKSGLAHNPTGGYYG